MGHGKFIDTRSLSHEALEALRIRAVRSVLSGESPESVARSLGVNRCSLYRWLNKYQYGGWEALRAKPIPGRPPKLTAKDLRRLNTILTDKDPLQLGFSFALWTVGMVRDVIHRKFDVKLSEVSTWRTLKLLGFSPQRPLRRAIQQNQARVKEWRENEFVKIKARAKRRGAAIFFGDESGIRSDYHSGTTWGKKGKTPVVESTGARFRINMLSAISPHGELRFMLTESNVTGDVFVEFLRRLIHGAQQPIFLIVDGHPTHKTKKVQQFVKSTQGMLELYFLPPYSPELNPDELVWSHVKRNVSRHVVKSRDHLKSLALGALRSLQRRIDCVRGFFFKPSCRYASA